MNDSMPTRTESSFSNSAHQEGDPSTLSQSDGSVSASDSRSMASHTGSSDPEPVRVRRLYSGDFSAPPGQLASETTMSSTSAAQPARAGETPAEDEGSKTLSPQQGTDESLSLERVPEEAPAPDNDACFEEWPEADKSNTDKRSSDDLEVGSCPASTMLTEVTDTPGLEEVDPSSQKYPSKNDKDLGGPCPGDPFAPRTGKCLIWRNVNMTLVCTCMIYECALINTCVSKPVYLLYRRPRERSQCGSY